jgi:hypothetical protein
MPWMKNVPLLAILTLAAGIAGPVSASAPDAKKKAPAPAPAPAAKATPFPYPGDALSSTSGAWLRLVETGRKTTPGTVEVDYRLEGGGFPPGKVYRLWQLGLAGDPEALCGALAADANGALVPDAAAAAQERSLCPPLEAIELGAYEYLPGEPYRVAVISSDDSVRAVATAFPFPIEGADGPRRLLLELTSADRRSFTVWGTGFRKDETLTTSMVTADGTYEGAAFSDAAGNVRILLNAPRGETGGTVTYEVRGAEGRPKLTYRWGAAR